MATLCKLYAFLDILKQDFPASVIKHWVIKVVLIYVLQI